VKASDIPKLIEDYFNANYQFLWLVGDEFDRYLRAIHEAGDKKNVQVICHDKVCGFYKTRPSSLEPPDKTNKPLIAWPAMVEDAEAVKNLYKNLVAREEVDEKGKKRAFFDPKKDAIFILKDWDVDWGLQPDGPKIIQQIRNLIHSNMGSQTFHGAENEEDVADGAAPKWRRGKRLIVCITATDRVPPHFPEAKPIVIPLPDEQSLRSMLDQTIFDPISQQFKNTKGEKGFDVPQSLRTMLSKACLGLTQQAAEDVVSLVFARFKRDCETKIEEALEVIEDAKARSAEAIPGLTYVGKDVMVEFDPPGYEKAIEWIKQRVNVDAGWLVKHKMKQIKAIGLVGAPGTGKSTFGFLCGKYMNRPLYLWNLGESKGGIVGASEANMRRGLQILQAQNAVAMIDDLDKTMLGSGGGSEYSGDGGTTGNMIQSLLTQMARPDNQIVFVLTMNRVQNVKPELLRKGRVDEIFYISRPNAATRKEVFRTHVKRRNFEWPDETGAMAELLADLMDNVTLDWVPSEIEALVEYVAFASRAAGLDSTLDWNLMVQQAKNTTPMCKMPSFADDVRLMEEMAKQFTRIGNVEVKGSSPKTAGKGKASRSLT
jgi:hypothetical protein